MAKTEAREEIEHEGEGITHLGFTLDAAMRFAIAVEGGPTEGSFCDQHADRAAFSFDAAEALWDEACKRFPEDECSVDDLDLGFRARVILNNLGCKTISDIACLTETKLLRMKNCGRCTVYEIKEALAKHGSTLTR